MASNGSGGTVLHVFKHIMAQVIWELFQYMTTSWPQAKRFPVWPYLSVNNYFAGPSLVGRWAPGIPQLRIFSSDSYKHVLFLFIHSS